MSERERYQVERVPASELCEGDQVLIGGALGAVDKTVFSLLDGGEDGFSLTFTDADSFFMPSATYPVLRVVSVSPEDANWRASVQQDIVDAAGAASVCDSPEKLEALVERLLRLAATIDV